MLARAGLEGMTRRREFREQLAKEMSERLHVLGFMHPIAFTIQDINDKLDAIRGAIENITLPAGSRAGFIRCTVSTQSPP